MIIDYISATNKQKIKYLGLFLCPVCFDVLVMLSGGGRKHQGRLVAYFSKQINLSYLSSIISSSVTTNK
jgi:hypothetical protein